MHRVNIFGMFHQVQVIISKFDALVNFSCLAGGLALTSLWPAHLFFTDIESDDGENNYDRDDKNHE